MRVCAQVRARSRANGCSRASGFSCARSFVTLESFIASGARAAAVCSTSASCVATSCAAASFALAGAGTAAPTTIESSASVPISVALCVRLGVECRSSGSRMASMRPSNSFRRAIASATIGVDSRRTEVTMSSRCSA